MAPLPPNSTARLFLDYTSLGVGHTMMIRFDDTPGIAADTADAYAAVFSQLMIETDSFFAARVSALGSDFSLPIEFGAVPGLLPNTTTPWGQDPESAQMSVVFRGVETGRRGRIEFFTPVGFTPWPPDNRYNPGEQATVDAFLADLVGLGEPAGDFPLQTVGGDHVAINQYVNIRLNAYWQSKQRLS